MPHITEMLDRSDAARVAVGVVSAAEVGAVENEVQALGLEGRFTFAVGSASPKRDALAVLVETYGMGRVAYLGDTEHDVVEALAAGVTALGFGAGYRPAESLRAAGADHVVSDLREVIAPPRSPRVVGSPSNARYPPRFSTRCPFRYSDRLYGTFRLDMESRLDPDRGPVDERSAAEPFP